MRYGYVGAAIGNLLSQLGLIAGATWTAYETARFYELQIVMAAVATTVLLVGAAVEERRRVALVLRETEHSLGNALRLASASELASALAHELKQPLAAISNYILAGKTLAAASQIDRPTLIKALNDAVDESDRAGKLISSIYFFYKSQKIRPTKSSVASLVQPVLNALAPLIQKHHIHLTFSPPTHERFALVEVVQIQTVLSNLLTNAIDELQTKIRENPQIAVECTMRDEALIISVEDNGSGIPDDMRSKIFDTRDTRKPDGLGLGLSISRSIIEAHEGRIWLEDSMLGGARFCFSIPRVSA
jgi:two-component system, LuxR family, sensor kinase FixL